MPIEFNESVTFKISDFKVDSDFDSLVSKFPPPQYTPLVYQLLDEAARIPPSEVADLLDKAADAMWMYGRCVDKLEDHDGKLCTIGALNRANDLDNQSVMQHHPLVLAATIALGKHLDDVRDPRWREVVRGLEDGPVPPIWKWNDSLPVNPENDAYITDTLRRCAKGLREG